MRILVEILHPAHVHVFRNAIQQWKERGDEVLVVSREKDCANQLLDAYGIPYVSISRIKASKVQLAGELIQRVLRMWKLARTFKPDLLIGIMGVTIAPVSRLIGKPAVVFYDTENAGITNRVVYPISHAVCTPDCYQGEVNGNHITYPSYHEFAYLHPNHFTPDINVLHEAGLNPEEPFFIVRFVSWQASHDIGETGFTVAQKQAIVKTLQQHGRVLITSEGALPEELEPLRFKLSVEKMHHVLAHATMLVGESATMASEAAVLGVPAVFISDTGRGYTDDLEERYDMVKNFTTHQADDALALVNEWLAKDDLAGWAHAQRQQMLEDKLDTTAWMIEKLDEVVKRSLPAK